MKAWTRKPPMTNKGPQCECGSGWLPTIMDNSRNRWACNACYQKNRTTCQCGHAKVAHEGHTVLAGTGPIMHCSQGDGCHAYNPLNEPKAAQ